MHVTPPFSGAWLRACLVLYISIICIMNTLIYSVIVNLSSPELPSTQHLRFCHGKGHHFSKVLLLNLLLHGTSLLSLPVLCHAINFAARSNVNMPYSSTKSLVFLLCLPELYPVYHHVTVCFSNWPCTTPTEYGFCWNSIFFRFSHSFAPALIVF